MKMKKRKIKLVLALLLFLTGFFIFIFPMITDTLYKEEVKNKIEDFDKKITKKDIKKQKLLDKLYKLMDSRNKKLYESKQIKFTNEKSYEYDDIKLEDYGLKNGELGFIVIPSINITLPIYLGANEQNMKLGAVHLTGSSYPIGGSNTNSVIAAHRGYYKTLMFRNIDKIKIGDELYIRNFKETLTYKANKIEIIDKRDIKKLTIKEGKDMITIISCHPFPYNYQRYVVHFERSQ